MTRYLPSARGWIAVSLVVFTLVFLPTIFPPRNATTGNGPPVPESVWLLTALTLGGCVVGCAFAVFRRRHPDKVAGIAASVVTLWMIVMCIRAAII